MARSSPIETLKVTAKKVKRNVFQRICSERRSEKKRTKLSSPAAKVSWPEGTDHLSLGGEVDPFGWMSGPLHQR